MIAIDWGTSNFRAFLLKEDGAVFERRSTARGVLRVPEGRFAEVLREQIGDWLAQGEHRIILCGMAGSRHGWLEADYVGCPAGPREIAGSAVKVPFDGAEVFILPGLKGTSPSGLPEVMRGEETMTMGVLDSLHGEGLVCLPGTHSKWVDVKDGAIVDFLTCMTGEVFAALRSHTILAQLMSGDDEIDQGAFKKGVACSREAAGGLLHHLFSVRTLALAGDLSIDQSSSYLSGLLIGYEVRTAMPREAKVMLLGAQRLCSLYVGAIESCGGTAVIGDADAAARGMYLIGGMLPWS